MQLFEPLQELLKIKGEHFDNRLCGIEHQLTRLVEQVTTSVAADEYAWLNGTSEVDAEKNGEVRIENSEKIGWEVQHVAITGSEEGNCAVYVGDIAPTNLVDALHSEIDTSRAKYYVAPQTSLIFHFYEQKEGGQCTVNLQVKRMLVRDQILTHSGRQWEATDGDLRIPAGHPLRDQEGAPLPGETVHNPPSVEIPSQ